MITRHAVLRGWFAGAVVIAAALAAPSFADDEPAKPSEKARIEQLAQAKHMVHKVLSHWEFETWNQLLAEDVTVSFKLGSVSVDSAGAATAVGTKLEANGRDAAKKLLKEVYGDLKKSVKITGEVAYGYDVILLGEMSVAPVNGKDQFLPIACHMHFNPKGKIDRLVLASVDIRQLLQAIRK